LADAVGVNIARQKLHGVVDGESGRNTAPRRIYVKVDILFGVRHLKEQQLSNDQIRHHIIDWGAEKDDAINEQTRINVVATFTAARLLDYHWD
jgi:hypothetical protein